MSPAQAVELAYRIAEHGRATAVLAALEVATDCTIPDAKLTTIYSTSGQSHLVELPHMFVRHMFQRGILRAEMRSYRDQLGESIAEDFGIIIEDDPDRPEPEQHQGSNAE